MSPVSLVHSFSPNFLAGFHLNNPAVIVKKTIAVSIPIFLFLAISNIPTAKADDEDVARCMADCVQKGGSTFYCGFICALQAGIKWYLQ